MYRRILLPLDGSRVAEQAIPHAVALAERFQAELILFKVLMPLGANLNLPPGAMKRAEAATLELAKEYLSRVADSIGVEEMSIATVAMSGRSP